MTPLNALRELIINYYREKYPNVPIYAIPVNTFNNLKPEKRELKRIERFTELSKGVKLNIVTNVGKRIDKRVQIGGLFGGGKIVGSVEYHKSTVQNGTADLVGLIQGRFLAVELKRIYKNGKDRQSQVQKDYQKEVEDAGGLYWIVTDFNDFYNSFNNYNS